MERLIYSSTHNGTLSNGINEAKRVARKADAKDRRTIIAVLGAGAPKKTLFHQDLVKHRHAARVR